MLQNFINKLSKACKTYGLSISLGKTEIMVQVPPTKGISLSDVDFASSPSRAQLGSLPVRISIDGVLLKEVDHFVYLGGVISNDGSLDKEISTRCKKASIAFGRLWRNVFGRKDISVEVKFRCIEQLY
jgi:hypothetical protein